MGAHDSIDRKREDARFAQVIAWRRAQLRVRAALTVTTTIFLLTCAPLFVAAAWGVAYGALQAGEHQLARLLARRGAPEPWRRRFELGALAVNSALFGAFCPLALSGGVTGLGGAAFGLASCMLHAVLTTRGSRRAFVAVMLPYVAYAGVLVVAVARLHAEAMVLANLGYAAMMTFAVCIMMWRISGRLMDAEEAALAEAVERRREADAANAAKSAFVSTVSHELRTPMTAVLAGASALRDETDGAARRHAGLILDAGTMMRRLLNDLLDLAKIEAGRLDVENAPFASRALVHDTLVFWRGSARDRGLRLRLEGARVLPAWAQGDATRLQQILNNLLSNAIKFTDQGSVTLAIGREPGGDITFEVRDTGAGMTPEQVGRLFQPFEQAVEGRARTHGGTGLGLSISRDLARLMGGDLTAASSPGAGSAFRLRLDLPQAEPVASARAPQANAGPEGLRVLIADDHEVNRQALELMMGSLGAEVSLASSGEAALEALAEAAFDLVLIDVNMGGLSGIEAAQILRRSQGVNRDVPIVAVTGSVGPDDLVRCREAGIDEVAAKPVTPQSLFEAVQAALSSPREAGRAKVA